ncbi:MAG: hypothetical protein IJ083_18575, partial [Clostridia bacterium]|nr:hypothetical protein [Clostridia bacterium]
MTNLVWIFMVPEHACMHSQMGIFRNTVIRTGAIHSSCGKKMYVERPVIAKHRTTNKLLRSFPFPIWDIPRESRQQIRCRNTICQARSGR